MDGLSLIIGIVGAIICGFAGSYIMKSKGRNPAAGAALGVLLGVIGLLITLAISPNGNEKGGTYKPGATYEHRDPPAHIHNDWR
jgi:hypothetical protein